MLCAICCHLKPLKRREKHPWMSNTFSKVDAINFEQVNAGWANSYEVEITSVHWL